MSLCVKHNTKRTKKYMLLNITCVSVNVEDVDSHQETAERTHAQQYQLRNSRKSKLQ